MMTQQDKYTRSARGQMCLARTPVCACNPDESVLAHLNGAGMGKKALNIHGCYTGFACHNWLDRDYAKTHTKAERDLIHLEAVIRTQKQMVADGVLILQEKPSTPKAKRKPIEKRERIKQQIQNRKFGKSQAKIQNRGFGRTAKQIKDDNDWYFADDRSE